MSEETPAAQSFWVTLMALLVEDWPTGSTRTSQELTGGWRTETERWEQSRADAALASHCCDTHRFLQTGHGRADLIQSDAGADRRRDGTGHRRPVKLQDLSRKTQSFRLNKPVRRESRNHSALGLGNRWGMVSEVCDSSVLMLPDDRIVLPPLRRQERCVCVSWWTPRTGRWRRSDAGPYRPNPDSPPPTKHTNSQSMRTGAGLQDSKKEIKKNLPIFFWFKLQLKKLQVCCACL